MTFTLTYDGLGVTNGAAVPKPYPGITAATVTHSGTDQHATPFEDVTFWGGVSPGNGYGDLTNVVIGPRGTPSNSGLDDPAWGFVSITPNHPGTYVRLLSMDLASFDDNNVDETGVGIYVHDEFPYIYTYWSRFVTAAGDISNATHRHIVFTNNAGAPVEGPLDVSLSIWWQARSGAVGVDNIKFEIVGPTSPLLARNDSFRVAQAGTLSVSEPGVLGNDLLREATGPLGATLVNGPEQGTLDLSTNGGFIYTPGTNFNGMDGFTYRAADQETNSATSVALISVLPPGALFYDDFMRPVGGQVLTPWQVAHTITTTGAISFAGWSITNGVLEGTSVTNSPGYVSVGENWSDYSVEVRARMPADGFGWRVGGRLNQATGRRYGVVLLPIGSGGSWVLRLIKYTGWETWSGSTLGFQSDVPVPGVGTTNLHTLKITFHGNHILAYWDGVQRMNVFDNNWEGPVYASGGVSVGMYTLDTPYTLSVEDVLVSGLNPPVATNLTVDLVEDTATNLVLQGYSPAGPVTFAIASGPTNGVLSNLNTNTGAVIYTPGTNFYGPDAFRFTVSDGTLLATGLVSVIVGPVEDAEPIATTFGAETPEDTVTNLMLLGSDVDGPVTFLILEGPTNGVLSAFNTNTGAITYAPATNYNGVDAFTFAVSEAGLMATGLVDITVTPVNDAPVLTASGPGSIDELTTLVMTNSAIDVDELVSALAFVLISSPTNAILDPNTGLLTWTPEEHQGPSTNVFMVKVADGGLPPLSATNVFTVTVNEVNQSPVLDAIGDQTLIEGQTLALTNIAADTDIPANLLSFGLGEGAPLGMTLTTNGVLNWTPSPDQAPSTNVVSAIVADNGSPSLSATQTFIVTVWRHCFEVESIRWSNNVATISWGAVPGQIYRLEYKDAPDGTNWTPVPPDVLATGPTGSTTDDRNAVPHRFYRVLRVP